MIAIEVPCRSPVPWMRVCLTESEALEAVGLSD
jgi:hypothetical protein